MTTLTLPALMTAEQLETFPKDDGIDRELINGRLRERPATLRCRRHSRAESRFGSHLENWREAQPEPKGEVLSGEAGFRLRRNPDTTVGIDVAYISPETAAANEDGVGRIEGFPFLPLRSFRLRTRRKMSWRKFRFTSTAACAGVGRRAGLPNRDCLSSRRGP